MEVRVPTRKLTAITFPADDAVFAERVRQVLDHAGADDLGGAWQALSNELSRVHPQVNVSPRDTLAGFGDTVLYVFRDGTARRSHDRTDWTNHEETARVVTDQTGRYVEANDAAAELFGVSPDQVIGATAGSFTRPDARIEDGNALWHALSRTGELHSLAVVLRPDGTETPVEFLTIRDEDGPGRNVTYLRAVG